MRLGRKPASAAALLLGFPLWGCGSVAAPTPTPAPSPTPVAMYQGNWFGTTSQGYPISFAVNGDQITAISFSYAESLTPGSGFTAAFCGASTKGSVADKPMVPIPIMSGGFTYTSCGQCSGAFRYDFTGTFGSGTVSGTLDFAEGGYVPLIGAICPFDGRATWSAARRP